MLPETWKQVRMVLTTLIQGSTGNSSYHSGIRRINKTLERLERKKTLYFQITRLSVLKDFFPSIFSSASSIPDSSIYLIIIIIFWPCVSWDLGSESTRSWPLGNQGIPNLFIFLMFNFPIPNFTLMLKVLKTVESSSSALDPAFLLSPVEILERRQCDIVLKSYCWKAWPLNQRELRSIPNYVTTNVPLDSHQLL